MAKQKKQETVSSVSDILGFILDQSSKPPEKRRPIKSQTAGFQAESVYVSTLVDALALPGTFTGEKYLNDIESIINPAVKVKTYNDRLGDTKIKASDLSKYYDNPNKFVDDLFKKGKTISKNQRIQWAGEQARMLAGSTYARSANLFSSYDDPEMKAILERGVGQIAGKSSQPTDADWSIRASHELMNKGALSRELQRLDQRINSTTDPAIKNRLKNKKSEITGLYDNVRNGKDAPTHFRDLLDKEFEVKQKEILNGRNLSELNESEFAEYNKFVQADNMIYLWGLNETIPGSNKEFQSKLNEFKKNKKDLLSQKETIKSSNLSSSLKKQQIDKINKQIKNINSASGTLNKYRFWGTLGKAEGTFYGIKNTLGPGGLEGFLNGDFFDPKKGYFGNPSITGKIIIKGNEMEFVKAKKQPYKDKKPLSNAYNETMVNLYYINPTNYMKSLLTGERFAWRADSNLEALKDVFGVEQGSGVWAGVAEPEFWKFFEKYQNGDPNIKNDLLNGKHKYSVLLNKVLKGIDNGNPEFLSKIERAQVLTKQYEKFSNLAYRFSGPQRLLNKLQDTGANLTKGLREKVVGLLSKTKFFARDQTALDMLKFWGNKGGGKALSSAISNAVITALKLTGSAVAPIVGFIVTSIASGVLEKLMKGVIQVVMLLFLVVGILGFVAFIGGVGTYSDLSKTDAYSREIPGEVRYNDEFKSYGGDGTGLTDESEYDNPNSGSLAEFVPGDLPDGENCLFVAGSSLRCSQGPYSSCSDSSYKQPSHYNSPAIDVAIGGNFAAPQFCDKTKGNCKVISVGQETCQGGSPAGGYVKFSAEYNGRVYEILVLHVAIGVSTGETLGSGQAVATITHDASWQNCSTGLHAHVTVKVNGSYVNPRDVLNQDFGCSVSDCPVEEVCYIKK